MFFDDHDSFPETLAFQEQCQQRYGFTLIRTPSADFKKELKELVQEGMEAILMGSRRTDPYCH